MKHPNFQEDIASVDKAYAELAKLRTEQQAKNKVKQDKKLPLRAEDKKIFVDKHKVNCNFTPRFYKYLKVIDGQHMFLHDERLLRTRTVNYAQIKTA